MRGSSLLLVFLAACASAPPPAGDVETARDSWQGASFDDIVRGWHVPSRSTKLADGREAHTWVSQTVTSRDSWWPSIGIFGGSGGTGFGTGVTMAPPGSGELLRCERTVIFQNARAVEQTWQGPAEYCASFGRK
jgi:hypothetical protein